MTIVRKKKTIAVIVALIAALAVSLIPLAGAEVANAASANQKAKKAFHRFLADKDGYYAFVKLKGSKTVVMLYTDDADYDGYDDCYYAMSCKMYRVTKKYKVKKVKDPNHVLQCGSSAYQVSKYGGSVITYSHRAARAAKVKKGKLYGTSYYHYYQGGKERYFKGTFYGSSWKQKQLKKKKFNKVYKKRWNKAKPVKFQETW